MSSKLLDLHVKELYACNLCPRMHKPVVSGRPILSKVMLIGQAPGDKEPKFGKPFAWTAGKTMFGWFEKFCGLNEEEFRSRVYMAAVCRCFPGKKSTGGDRVPDPEEIKNCSRWLQKELEILSPELIIPVGKLAMTQILPIQKLDEMIGKKYRVNYYAKDVSSFVRNELRRDTLVRPWAEAHDHLQRGVDVIPLPHPSGASPWHRMEPGKTLLEKALSLIAKHSAWKNLCL